MAIDITADVTISRPRAEVAAYAMDPANDPVWIGGIVEARQVSDHPFGVGTRVARVAHFLGRRMDYTPEVREYVPGERLAMATDKPFDMTITYAFEDNGADTHASIRVQGGGSGFYSVAGPLLAPLVKRSVGRDLRTLKRLLESGA